MQLPTHNPIPSTAPLGQLFFMGKCIFLGQMYLPVPKLAHKHLQPMQQGNTIVQVIKKYL
jgi:hypothetical protein